MLINQFGYQQNRSKELAATYFIDNIRKHANNGKMVGAVFMDLSRAFDIADELFECVCPFSGLGAQRVKSYGVNDKEISW